MTSSRFERMVIGLPQGTASQSGIRTAADLAEFLNIELLGTFIADENLRSLFGLPGRELRMLDLQWQPIDPARISRDLQEVTDFVRNRFIENVGSRTVKTSFDTIAGAHILGSLIRTGDIVAIVEPTHPGDRITQQFVDLLDAAFATAAAVLVVPRRVLRTSGPITAVATSNDDPSIRAALEISAALKERLIILSQSDTPTPAEILTDARELGVPVEQVRLDTPAMSGIAPQPSSRQSQERLRVISRITRSADTHGLFSTLAGVPLLVVKSHQADSDAFIKNRKPSAREVAESRG